MRISKEVKVIQQGYCKTVLATNRKLTKDLFNKINRGDEQVMRSVYEEQRDKILKHAETVECEETRKIIESQAESVQEVLDNLTDLLKQ